LLSVLKTELRGHVEVVQDENDDLSVIDDVSQVSEFVDLYRVTPSIYMAKKSNFHVFNNIFVDVGIEKLNVVLSSSGHRLILNKEVFILLLLCKLLILCCANNF
jgi:hypothetical protein